MEVAPVLLQKDLNSQKANLRYKTKNNNKNKLFKHERRTSFNKGKTFIKTVVHKLVTGLNLSSVSFEKFCK